MRTQFPGLAGAIAASAAQGLTGRMPQNPYGRRTVACSVVGDSAGGQICYRAFEIGYHLSGLFWVLWSSACFCKTLIFEPCYYASANRNSMQVIDF